MRWSWASEAHWIEGSGLAGEIGEHRANPGPESVGGVLDEAAGRCFGGRGDE
jgi:hypothetical protein